MSAIPLTQIIIIRSQIPPDIQRCCINPPSTTSHYSFHMSGSLGNVKRGLAFTLSNSHNLENHILPTNALQYSQLNRRLYTGGRDGVVKIWGSQSQKQGTSCNLNRNHGFDSSDDLQEQFLKLETSIQGNPLQPLSLAPPTAPFSVEQSYPIHFDWINDMALVNEDTGIVLCSLDLSIKYTNLDSGSSVAFFNLHTDYVEKVVAMLTRSSVVSGALDGKVVVWDLSRLTPMRTICGNASPSSATDIADPSSIYLLATKDNLVAVGGIHNTVDIYDVRSPRPFIRQLIGHNGNVRSLLMNDNSIISGSLDLLIRVWDLRTFTTRRTIMAHDSAVWLLHSPDQSFTSIVSGDREGNIVATNLRYATHDNHLGILAYVHRGDSSILSIAGDETTLFFSDYDGIYRDLIPDLSDLAHYQYLRAGGNLVDNESDSDSLGLQLLCSTNDDLALLAASLFPCESPVSMFVGVDGGPCKEFTNTYITDLESNQSVLAVEILMHQIDQPVEPVAFCQSHLWHRPIFPHSIVARQILNDKRHVLVQYANGSLSLWDIILGREIQSFGDEELLETVAKRLDSHHTLGNWCEVSIRAGKLFITVTESNVSNVEVYHDELGNAYAGTIANAKLPEERVNIGALLLRSVFKNYSDYELAFDKAMRQKYVGSSIKSNSSVSSGPSMDLGEEAHGNVLLHIQKNQTIYMKTTSKSLTPESEPPAPYISLESFCPKLNISVIELLPDLGNAREIFNISLKSLGEDMSPKTILQLREYLPQWMARPLLCNEWPTRDAPRISFLLVAALDDAGKKLRVMGNSKKLLPTLKGTTKLVLHRMLRGSKVLQYIVENFDNKTNEMKKKLEPRDWLVLECRGQEIDPSWTLQTIQLRLWKSGGEVELTYRRR